MSQIHSFTAFENAIDRAIVRWEQDFGKNDVTKINLSTLENIYVDYFGGKTAVKYLVNVKKGNEGEFYLTPFVAKTLSEIHQAMLNYGLNWQLALQKDRIMVNLPILTTEKKMQIVKKWKATAEHCHVEVRKLRHDFLDYWKKDEKIAREELVNKQQQVQKIVESAKNRINHFLKNKMDALLKV